MSLLTVCNWFHETTALDPVTGQLLPGVPVEGNELSHGLCQECLKKCREEIDQTAPG